MIRLRQRKAPATWSANGFVLIVTLGLWCLPAVADYVEQQPATAKSTRALLNGNAPYRDTSSEALNIMVNGSAASQNAGAMVWSYDVNGIGTRYIRLYFDDITAPVGSEFDLRIYDQDAAQLVAEYSSDRFAQKSTFFTDLLPPGKLQVRLISSSGHAGLKFRLAALVRETPDNGTVPQTAAIRWNPVNTYPDNSELRRAATAVALVHVGEPPLVAACTGILVKSDLVITSFHCMAPSSSFSTGLQNARMCLANAPRSCDDVLFEFDVLNKAIGKVAHCKEVVGYDETQDFVILRVSADDLVVLSARSAPGVAELTSGDGQPLTILEHPLGFPMVADDSCRLRGMEGTDLLHNCDTQSGSSGAPLFDSQMHWVGTHYRGPYPDDWTGKQIEEYLKCYLAGTCPQPLSRARASAEIMKCVP
jgi:hypothetical protein